MFKHAIHGVTVSSVLDKRRSNANGDYPVRILVNFQREKKYYTTGKMCSEETWEKMPTTKTKEIIDLRNEIHIVFDLIKNHVLELLTNDKFSLLNLDASLRVSTGKSLVELFEQRIAKLKKATQIGTMESYRSTLANIKRYKGNKAIPLEKVTVDWLKKFEEHMTPSKSISTIGKADSTLSGKAQDSGIENSYLLGILDMLSIMSSLMSSQFLPARQRGSG